MQSVCQVYSTVISTILQHQIKRIEGVSPYDSIYLNDIEEGFPHTNDQKCHNRMGGILIEGGIWITRVL